METHVADTKLKKVGSNFRHFLRGRIQQGETDSFLIGHRSSNLKDNPDPNEKCRYKKGNNRKSSFMRIAKKGSTASDVKLF